VAERSWGVSEEEEEEDTEEQGSETVAVGPRLSGKGRRQSGTQLGRRAVGLRREGCAAWWAAIRRRWWIGVGSEVRIADWTMEVAKVW
jgi:hypothetical protein